MIVLQLHRTGITRNGLESIVAANKKIENICLRPLKGDGMLLPSDLAVLGKFENLQSLSIGGNFNQMDFDFKNHLEWIISSKCLKELVAPIKKSNDSAFSQLIERDRKIGVSFSYY